MSTYLRFRDSELKEWEFVSAVAAEADCGLLLDVNNVYVSAFNHGFEAERYIDAIPADRVYVNNFRHPERPRLLELPRGDGQAFVREMARARATIAGMVPDIAALRTALGTPCDPFASVAFVAAWLRSPARPMPMNY